nr:hypothetical protein [uncultured Desulfobacter sp.]
MSTPLLAENQIDRKSETESIAYPEENKTSGSKSDIASEDSPWLAVPMVSSDPKVGTAGGGMVGYLFKIDPDSTSSMVGVGGTYSTTDSLLAGAFLRSFWDSDNKRFTLFMGSGRIKNDY